jgi:hypothetical protein
VLKLFEQAYDEVGISSRAIGIKLRCGSRCEAGHRGYGCATGSLDLDDGNACSCRWSLVYPPGGCAPDLGAIIQQIDALPPEAKVALGNAMAKGVPIAQALQQIMQLVSQQGPSPQQPVQ